MQLYAERRRENKQQSQFLSENEEGFLPFSTDHIVDTATEEAGRDRQQTKSFRHSLVHRQNYQGLYFRPTHTNSTSQAATENATNYPIQHREHPQPLQC